MKFKSLKYMLLFIKVLNFVIVLYYVGKKKILKTNTFQDNGC